VLVYLLIRWLVLAAAIWLTALLLPGIEVGEGFFTLLWVALLFGIVNAFIGTILRILTLPLTVLTLGLFALLVNAALLGITAWLSDDLDVDGFWAALFGALLISLISAILNFILRDRNE
jgi:putative membrane protein